MKRYFLRTLREQRRLTQTQLEARSGVPQTRISKLETHASHPNVDTAIKLAGALGVDVARLCFGPDPAARASKPRRKRRPAMEAA
jgi:transcriptional regulator with XRE-family HTH domain